MSGGFPAACPPVRCASQGRGARVRKGASSRRGSGSPRAVFREP